MVVFINPQKISETIAPASAGQYKPRNLRPFQSGASSTLAGNAASFQGKNIHCTHPRSLGNSSAAGMSPATAAAGAGAGDTAPTLEEIY